MTNSTNLRELVLDMLMEILRDGVPSHVVISQTLEKYQYLEKNERSFISRVTEGTLENVLLLDYVINQFSNTKTIKMKPLIRNLLRLSVYQLLYMDSIPDSAVCNEAVKIATKRKFVNLKGFVNGVLRNIARSKNEIKYPDIEKSPIEYYSIMFSMPEWMVQQIIKQYGMEKADIVIRNSTQICEGVTVRINTIKVAKAEVIKELTVKNIEVSPLKLYENGISISGFDYLSSIEAFIEGKISVQDESSMMVAVVAEPKEGQFIIDMCAAPGGKSLHLAELANDKCTIEARDISEYKTSLIEENIERVGMENIVTRILDATILDEKSIEKADVVIADVPCSGLGVIAKKSDIKYNMTIDKQKELVLLQQKILDNAVKYVKNNGTLIFSTCTINKDENIENMKWLLDRYDLEPVDISEKFPKGFHEDETRKGYIQLLQGIDGADGFFISKLKKKH